jgi:hypothetical protein
MRDLLLSLRQIDHLVQFGTSFSRAPDGTKKPASNSRLHHWLFAAQVPRLERRLTASTRMLKQPTVLLTYEPIIQPSRPGIKGF